MGQVSALIIYPNHLAYRWKVEMKKSEIIKEEGGNKMGGWKDLQLLHEDLWEVRMGQVSTLII